MASQRISRYIAVQQAKGIDPDPQQIARMIQEDTQAQIEGVPEVQNRTEAIQSSAAIQPSIEPAGGDTGSFAPTVNAGEQPLGNIGDVGEVDLSDPTLGETVGFEMSKGTVTKGFAKSGIKGAFASLMTPSAVMSKGTTALKAGTSSIMAPVSLALMLNNMLGESISAGQIGHSIGEAFGEDAAQEAANVMSGRADLNSISTKGQNAYANAMVAAENAPKSLIAHAYHAIKGTPPTPITSTVTPHHTETAISEAFQVSPNAEAMSSFSADLSAANAPMSAEDALMGMPAFGQPGGIGGDSSGIGEGPTPGTGIGGR
jgi:hypothetical protein